MRNIQERMPLNIQLFAEDNGDGVPTTENEENQVSTNEPTAQKTTEAQKKEEKTYTRDEVERIKAAERASVRAELKKEQEAKEAEAQKLAKMDEEQKSSYAIAQANKRAETAESELNAYKLKDEAIKQATEKGVDLDLMQTLDYTKETAESITEKIEIFANTSKKIHERAISEYSKEETPQSGEPIKEKTLEECKSYEDFANYYEKHPKK